MAWCIQAICHVNFTESDPRVNEWKRLIHLLETREDSTQGKEYGFLVVVTLSLHSYTKKKYIYIFKISSTWMIHVKFIATETRNLTLVA